MTGRLVPPYPPRRPGPVAVWRGLIGERARTLVYGWSERAFREPYMRRNVLGYRVHIPLDPESVQRVLLDNAANYQKPRLVKRLLAPVIGRGLLSSDGTLWREQRRIVAASFTPPAVDALVPVFAKVAEAAAAGWGEGVRDVAREATATTMRVISNALFSGDRRLTSAEAMAHIAAALDGVSEARMQVLLGLPMIPVSLRGYRGRRGQVYLRKTLSALVRERLAGDAPDDFVTHMIHALRERFPADEAIELAVDNAATFYLAGHETTANTVTWTLYLLAEQPELQEKAAAEAREALAAGVDSALPDRLPLLRMIVEESLRLYPPAPRFDREAVAADRLGEHDIRPGDLVSIWPWLLHRHQRLWDDPDTFDHSRFAPEARKGRHRFQYIPFGGGPRMCVGARFAMAEGLAILAVWLARYRFAPVPGREVRLSGAVTLRPAGGMPLTLWRRS
ncbi:MAG TPA: cytochrome P450 [Sphingomicrobium sp.]|nr:cytochrome P450 [Sphingomicrobium sp.]